MKQETVKSGKSGTCPRCGKVGGLTRDHIIPQVLVRIARKYGIPNPEENQKIEMVCGGCNGERGHRIIEDTAKVLKEAILDKREKEGIYISARDLMIIRSASSS